MNGNYSINPWMRDMPVQVARPNATYEDAMAADALTAAMTEPAERIRARRPPIPIELFPPREGYDHTPIGISDIVSLEDRFERRDFSGKTSGFVSGLSNTLAPM